MNCQDFQQQLDQHADREPAANLEMSQHATGCADCAALWALTRRLRQQLYELPAPIADAGFADRVLASVRPRRRPLPALRYALAASILVALGVTLNLQRPATEPAALRVVQLQPVAVQPLRLLFNSPRAVQDVTVHLALPEGVELAAYPGQRELHWQTNLQSGANLLELPLRLTGNGGVLTASLSLGDEQRQFSVRLQAAPRSSAVQRPHPSLATASAAGSWRNSEVETHA